MNPVHTHQASGKVNQPDYFEKGRLFEEYIKGLFNERKFRLLKWRKAEKFSDGVFSLDSSNPDLELVFTGTRHYRFAVECKWRKEFINGRITWANDYQICSYESFEDQKRIPVFIAIGIGGEPSAPEKLFVTPLRNISMYSDVYESDLIAYKRKPQHKFFYDTVQLKLF